MARKTTKRYERMRRNHKLVSYLLYIHILKEQYGLEMYNSLYLQKKNISCAHSRESILSRFSPLSLFHQACIKVNCCISRPHNSVRVELVPTYIMHTHILRCWDYTPNYCNCSMIMHHLLFQLYIPMYNQHLSFHTEFAGSICCICSIFIYMKDLRECNRGTKERSLILQSIITLP